MSQRIVSASPINMDAARLIPGIPSGVRFGNLPDSLTNLMNRRGSFYVPASEIYPLARQVTDVSCCGKPSFKSAVMRNGQLAYWLPTECSVRHEYTNQLFKTRNGDYRGAVGFPQLNVTPLESQQSYEREMDAGMVSLWTVTVSPAGMYTITMAPLPYARLLLEGHILLGKCPRLHEQPRTINAHLFSVSVPWGRYDFSGGKHVYANAIADYGLSISADFGDGYAGRQKKGQMGAHMVFLKSKGRFVGHIGVGGNEELIGMFGSSGVGKSQVVEPEPDAMTYMSALEAIRKRFPRANFGNIRNDTVIIIEGRKAQTTRALVVDDIACIFVDPSNGSVWVYCLEGGYYIRIDQWDRRGIIPVIDRVAFSETGFETEAIWSNTDVVDGLPVMGSFHDLDGRVQKNPRVSVRKSAYAAGERLHSDADTPRQLAHLVFGTASSVETPLFHPPFSVVSLPQGIATAGPSFRTAAGTQSFSASGNGQGWVPDAGFTQAQFTARGPAAVTEDMLPSLSRISHLMRCYTVSQRVSTLFTQKMLYDALWTLRRMIELGVDLRQHITKKLPGRYWGWAIRHPDIDPRITDPYELVPVDILEEAARVSDRMITDYWIGMLDKDEIAPDTKRYIRNLLMAPMPSHPADPFILTCT